MPSATSTPPKGDIEDQELPDAPPTENGNTQTSTNKVALQDIFAGDSDLEDMDDEDILPSSPPTSNSQHGASQPSPPTTVSQPAEIPILSHPPKEAYSDPTIMLQFYTRLFPFRTLFLWLNHSPNPSSDFANREFAFTLSNDAYLRYQSYPSADLLKRDILKLNPSRFEIGPEYTTNPRDRKTLRNASTFKPLKKELVFDIDLTDYDDIRTCCTKANICEKCWRFATMTIRVVDVALREDFGFEHIMWVYSGRRGVHAWISDKAAREMNDEQRKALVGWFEVLKGGAQGGKRVQLKRPLHPHLRRSLEILKPYFELILEEQEPFLSEAGEAKLLHLLPDKVLGEALKKKWASAPERPSRRKWDDIDKLAKSGVSPDLDTKALVEAKQDILLEYTYPRLDVEVGKKRIHLLKSPFVVHPGTGRVCVPITYGGNMDKVESFDPLTVPKVTELLQEIEEYGSTNGEMTDSQPDGTQPGKLRDWEKTSLKPFVNMFDDHVRSLLKSEDASLKRQREEDGITGADGMEF